MQRLGGDIAILNHRDADIAIARIKAIRLRPRGVIAREYAQSRFLPELERHGFAAALRRHVEPEKEAAGRTLVAITVADDLIGEIELGPIERAVLLHVRFITIGRDRD